MIAGLAATGLGTGLFNPAGGGVQPPEAESPTPQPTPINIRTYESEPEMAIDTTKQYIAVIKTAKGDIRVELFADEAPRAVNNFVFLARDGYFDGLTFHRVLPEAPNFIAQAGDPTCDAAGELRCSGDGGPGYTLPLEENGRSHQRGAIAMAATRSQEIHGSQFYILLNDRPDLEGDDVVFGQVEEESMAIVEKLTPRNACLPNQDPEKDNCDIDPPPGDEIITVTIEEA